MISKRFGAGGLELVTESMCHFLPSPEGATACSLGALAPGTRAKTHLKAPKGRQQTVGPQPCCRPFRAGKDWGGTVFLGLTRPGYMLSPTSGLASEELV